MAPMRCVTRVTHAALFCLAACATSPSPPIQVQHFGVMREVMQQGKTGPRAALADYQHKGWYAVGALAGLAGEVLIDDGVVYTSRERAESITDRAGDAQATLLTVASVGEWRELPLAEGSDLEAIESAIHTAMLMPIDIHPPSPDEPAPPPVPFIVLANAATIELHVARGSCPHTASDPEHEPHRWHGDAQAGAVRIIGFYAPGRAGVMTHHGTAIHAHALVTGASGTRAMGHVDNLVVGPGARLLVPLPQEDPRPAVVRP